jgi:hypothetical protein
MRENKFTVHTSEGKVMATIFWDSEDIFLVEILKTGDTINLQRHVQTLKKLKQQIQTVLPNREMNEVPIPI